MAGAFICLEGIDGAGKGTQAAMLVDKLRSENIACELYHYPDYSSVYGKRIKEFLDKKININVEELALLYMVDMVKDKEEVIRKLDEGKVIVVDRYIYSTIAYQSAGGMSYVRLTEMEKMLEMPVPSVVFYLDIPVKISLERKSKLGRSDRFETAGAYLDRVSEAYKMLFDGAFFAGRWERIDGAQDINRIGESIYGTVARMLR